MQHVEQPRAECHRVCLLVARESPLRSIDDRLKELVGRDLTTKGSLVPDLPEELAKAANEVGFAARVVGGVEEEVSADLRAAEEA